MTLQVIAFVNHRPVAMAAITNLSDDPDGLPDVSNYACHAASGAWDGVPGYSEMFDIEAHNRRQNVWALIEKVAKHVRLNALPPKFDGEECDSKDSDDKPEEPAEAA